MSARSVVLLTTNLARAGAEMQVAELAVRLRHRGWETAVISLLRPSAFEQDIAAAGAPVYSLGMREGKADPKALVRLARLLARLRPQVLHSHMFHANVMARVARLFCPAPALIATIHSLAETPRSGPREGGAGARDRVYRLTDALCDRTVAVSEAVAARHAGTAAHARKLLVIPNGIDAARFRPDPQRRAEVRRALGIGDEFVWLAAGRLMWKKDYATMLRAFARHGGGVLLVAGEGPQRDELSALAGELRANVRFLGARDDMPDLMRAADAFLLSSVVEGLPVVLLEAAASGLPVAATDVGGVKEVVAGERHGFLVPPGDFEAFAGAMDRLAGMPPESRRAMGEAARDHVVRRFDFEAVTSRWEQLYRELLAESAARGPKPRWPV